MLQNIWSTAGFLMVVVLAGLQGIPRGPLRGGPGGWSGLRADVPAHHAAIAQPDSLLRAPGLVPDPPTLQNYVEIFRTMRLFVRWIGNSLIVTVVTVLTLLVLSLMAGYAFARIRFPGRAFLFVLMLGTILGLIPGFVGTLTAGIFLASQFLRALPRELEEAALLDGLSAYATFVRVILPLTGPGSHSSPSAD